MIKDYFCTSCGNSAEYGEDAAVPVECPNCQSHSCRVIYRKREDFKSTGNECNVDSLMKENHRYSVSLAVLDEQLPAARKMHPQAEWKKFGNSWRPLIRNRAEKLKMLKQANFYEYDPPK